MRAGFDLLDDVQAGDVDHADGAVVAVTDEGETAVLAEADFVVAAPGLQVFEGFEALAVDHRDAGVFGFAGVVADPQQAFIRLQCHAHRLAASGDRVEDFELLAVDDGHFAGRRHRDEYALVVFGGDPVHRRLLEFDPRQGAGDAADRHRRIDHSDAGVAVHHQQEIAVEVEQRPRADVGFEKHPDPGFAALVAALGLIGGEGLRIDPGARRYPGQRLAGSAVGDAELHIGEFAFAQLAVGGQWLEVEIHRHAVTVQRLTRPGLRQRDLTQRQQRPGHGQRANTDDVDDPVHPHSLASSHRPDP